MYDELIDALRLCVKYGKADDALANAEQAADAIEELSKKYLDSEVDNTNLTGWLAEEHAKHLWIPVAERLPKESGDYLVFSIGGTWNQVSNIEIMFYDGERFFTSSFYCPIYWMPLPEPPKEER